MRESDKPEPWHRRAHCRPGGPAGHLDFFAEDKAEQVRCVVACAGCPVLDECREDRDEFETRREHVATAVWAGERPTDRRRRLRATGATVSED